MGQNLDRFRTAVRRESALLIVIMLSCLSVMAFEAARSRFTYHSRRSHQVGFQRTPAIALPALFLKWRQRFIDEAKPHDPMGLVRGIFLGDDSEIKENVRDLFRTAGLSHLLAASGFNCWIVSFFFGITGLALLRTASTRLPSRLELWLRLNIQPLSRLLGAWLFWSWTDQSPPITRSVALISTQHVLELLRIRAPFARVLFVQYLLSLLLVPSLWHSASFQLTFGCLFGMTAAARLAQAWRPDRDGFPRQLFEYFSTGLGACLGTVPTTFIFFGEMNFTSLLTNWFSVPLVSVALMPLGLAAMLLLCPLVPTPTLATDLLLVSAGHVAWLLHWLLARYMEIIPPLIWHP